MQRGKMKIETTAHPAWVEEFLEFIGPYQSRVVHHRYFRDMAGGSLTLRQFHGGLTNFYPLVEAFPKYMALNLAKVPAGNSAWNEKARWWLITNMTVEREHTRWWKQWAKGFGVADEAFEGEIYPPPEMDAINHYLWRICTHGSLAEGMAATNFAVEGPTGEWTKSVKEGLRKYQDANGVLINARTLEWVAGHAQYDDKHPDEALEIIKAHATTKEEQQRVRQAARRAMEYYAMALDACYDDFPIRSPQQAGPEERRAP